MAFNDLACGHLYLASLSLKVLFGHQGYISSKSQWKGNLPAVSCQYPKKSQWQGNLPAGAVALAATLLIGVQGQLILGVVHHLCHIISIVIGITYRYKYDII